MTGKKMFDSHLLLKICVKKAIVVFELKKIRISLCVTSFKLVLACLVVIRVVEVYRGHFQRAICTDGFSLQF